MIVDLIFGLVNSLAQAVLGLLPDIEPPDLQGMVTAAAPVFSNLGWINKYVPVDQAGIALGLLATYWFVLYLVRFVIWLASKLYLLGSG